MSNNGSLREELFGTQETQESWEAALALLPRYLVDLLASKPYGKEPDREAPPKSHGVYLFTENGRNLYVGRCGLTDRARRSGKGHSNFRTRYSGHTRPSSGHNQATFAWRLTLEALDKDRRKLPSVRKELERHPRFRREFQKQKARVRAMEFRVVEINDNFHSYIFEPYAAAMLETPYNSWATS